MDNKTTFNDDERDCLQELMNISYGSATAEIAQIIDKYATLNIPKIKTASLYEFKVYLKEKIYNKNEHYITNQLIKSWLSFNYHGC